MTASETDVPPATRRTARGVLFVLGNTLLFALLGGWAGSIDGAPSPQLGALLGAALGLALGTAFRKWVR